MLDTYQVLNTFKRVRKKRWKSKNIRFFKRLRKIIHQSVCLSVYLSVYLSIYLLSLDEMRKQQKAIMMYKIVHGHAPSYLK